LSKRTRISKRASVEASASDSAMADSSDSKLFGGGCLGKSRRFDYIGMSFSIAWNSDSYGLPKGSRLIGHEEGLIPGY